MKIHDKKEQMNKLSNLCGSCLRHLSAESRLRILLAISAMKSESPLSMFSPTGTDITLLKRLGYGSRTCLFCNLPTLWDPNVWSQESLDMGIKRTRAKIDSDHPQTAGSSAQSHTRESEMRWPSSGPT